MSSVSQTLLMLQSSSLKATTAISGGSSVFRIIDGAIVNALFARDKEMNAYAFHYGENTKRIKHTCLLVMMPTMNVSPNIATVRHKLVVLSKTPYCQNKLRRKF